MVVRGGEAGTYGIGGNGFNVTKINRAAGFGGEFEHPQKDVYEI
jgi:hypothetical protein